MTINGRTSVAVLPPNDTPNQSEVPWDLMDHVCDVSRAKYVPSLISDVVYDTRLADTTKRSSLVCLPNLTID
jgi:hypothetical protein